MRRIRTGPIQRIQNLKSCPSLISRFRAPKYLELVALFLSLLHLRVQFSKSQHPSPSLQSP